MINKIFRYSGFTLAEVLITLGIIGVVAALTIPGLLTKCQEIIIKNQFKKEYSVIQQALKTVEFNLDYIPNCYYWDNNPFGASKCVSWSDVGECTKFELADGGNLPTGYNGNFSDCDAVKEEMKKILKIAQICPNMAYAQGCIPKYKGNDTIYRINNKNQDGAPSDYDTNKATSSCSGWRESNILNVREAWVLMDGAIILFYSGFQLFAVDVNGKKGPNRWGYDIFQLESVGDGTLPIKLVGASCVGTEAGGIPSSTMLKQLFK